MLLACGYFAYDIQVIPACSHQAGQYNAPSSPLSRPMATDFSFSFNAVPLGAPQHIVNLVVLHSILAACLCNMAPQRLRCVGSASTSAKCLPPHSARHFSDTFLQRTAPTDRRAHRLTSLTPWSEPCVTALQQSSPDSSL